MEATERIAHFVAETRLETLSAEVVTAAKRAVLDTLGVTLAGAAEEGSRLLLDSLSATADAGPAHIFGTDLRASASQAALANGALGHALDFDDVNVNMRGHPSVPVLPAVLAVAEAAEAAEAAGSDGGAVLSAFVVGFEVECKLGRALGASSYARGWHATSVAGALGAAAACANLLRLDAARTRNALGIASSMACGTRQNFGTMTKPLHAGLAARAGVEAADLAARGFTAAPDILEAPMGFGVLFSPGDDWRPERIGDPGKPWDILSPGINVKQYPCCYMTHQALDATLAATERRPLDAAEVESIEVRVSPGSTSALIHHRPTSGLEGKFSMEYTLAAGVLDGRFDLAAFSDDGVTRPAIAGILPRMHKEEDPRCLGGDPDPGARSSGTIGFVEVTATRRDGVSETVRVDKPTGSPERELSWHDLETKFHDCAAQTGMTPAAAAASFAAWRDLRHCGDVTTLLEPLAGSAG